MIGPSGQAPDLMEPVIGYRRFRLVEKGHDFELRSPYQGETWHTAKKTATCVIPVAKTEVQEKLIEGICKPAQHPAPHPGCKCGLYAYFEPRLVRKRDYFDPYVGHNGDEMLALVTLSGRMEVHRTGMRAQHLEIRALGYCEWWSADQKAGLKVVADRLGVLCVEQSKLGDLASEFGSTLPDSLRPQVPDDAKPSPEPADPRDQIREHIEAMRPKPSRRIPRVLWSIQAALNIGCVYWIGLPNATANLIFAAWGIWAVGREFPTKAV